MGLLNLACVTLGAALGYAACALWEKRFNETPDEEKVNFKCLFFTPKQVSCNKKCSVSREQNWEFPCNNCGLNALCAVLAKAKKELKVCMYLITSDDVCNTIIEVFNKGVEVKIITDKFVCDDALGAGLKLTQLKRANIPVKIVQCAYMMHNKFAIIDNETVVIGSINWTRQGNLNSKLSKRQSNCLGNLNSKISERPSKATENQISQNAQKNKKLLEKTTSALSLNSDNGKLPKAGDKKKFKFLTKNESRIRPAVRQEPLISEKDIDARNVGSDPTPVQPRSDPVITGIATMTRFSSVPQNKVPPGKKTIKHAALNKLTNDTTKKCSLLKPEFTPTQNFKTVVNSNNLTGLKKSTTCPPCEKLVQDVNCSRAKTTFGWDLSKSRTGNIPRPRDKTRSLSRETTEKKGAKDTLPGTSKKSPTLTEIKRMKSEGDSIVSRTTRISAKTPPLQPRQATSETKDFSKVNIHSKTGPDEKISATAREPQPTEKKRIGVFKTGIKNHVLHVHTAEFVVTGREMKDHNRKPDSDVNQPPRRENSDPHQDMPDLSSPRPIEYYDSFDSIERKNRDDEISSLDEKTAIDFEREIVEACEKNDFLCGSEDNFSDIIRQLHSLYDEQGPDAEGPASANKTNVPSTRKVHCPNLNADEKLPRKRADEENEEFPLQKNIPLPLPKSPEPGNKPVITHSKQGKSSRADYSLLEHGNRNTEKGQSTKSGPIRDSEAEVPCIPSEFFQTHKNLGFIGKEVDEEHVSFDPALVTLYQPRETQMLFYDLANCVATQAYLKMCGINYVLAERKNAEHMSPSGKIPFVSSCLCIIPEFEGIVSFMQYKKYSCVRVRECDKAAFRATISMIVDTLEVAERYICWCDEETVIKYTKPMIGALFPFPLNHVIYWKKKFEERKRLALEETKEKSFEAVLRQINYCFNTLSQILGENSFFFGDACSEIDALVYGHIYAAFTTKQEGLFRDLQFIIKQFPNLIMFAINVDKMFLLNKFPSLNLPSLG